MGEFYDALVLLAFLHRYYSFFFQGVQFPGRDTCRQRVIVREIVAVAVRGHQSVFQEFGCLDTDRAHAVLIKVGDDIVSVKPDILQRDTATALLIKFMHEKRKDRRIDISGTVRVNPRQYDIRRLCCHGTGQRPADDFASLTEAERHQTVTVPFQARDVRIVLLQEIQTILAKTDYNPERIAAVLPVVQQ